MVRLRTLLQLLLPPAIVAAIAVGVLLFRPSRGPPTDEEIVREMAESYLTAEIEGDFKALWDFFHNDGCRECLPESGIFMMPTRSRFLRNCSWERENDPKKWQERAARYRSVKFHHTRIDGGSARIRCTYYGEGYRWKAAFAFEKHHGEWHLLYLSPGGLNTLRRKVSAHLPVAPVRPVDVDFVLEVGPGVLTEEQRCLLGARLDATRKAESRELKVLIYTSPELSFQRVIDAMDAVKYADIEDCLFSAGPERPIPPGIRLNGVDLDIVLQEMGRLDPGTFDPASNHPAVKRIIGLSQR